MLGPQVLGKGGRRAWRERAHRPGSLLAGRALGGDPGPGSPVVPVLQEGAEVRLPARGAPDSAAAGREPEFLRRSPARAPAAWPRFFWRRRWEAEVSAPASGLLGTRPPLPGPLPDCSLPCAHPLWPPSAHCSRACASPAPSPPASGPCPHCLSVQQLLVRPEGRGEASSSRKPSWVGSLPPMSLAVWRGGAQSSLASVLGLMVQ